MARVTRIGVEELMRDLRALDDEVIAKVGRPALRVGGQAAVEIAQAIAPRRTGRFARSIHMVGADGATWNPEGSEDQTMEPPEPETKTKTAVAVGTRIFYGQEVEFGSRRQPASRAVGRGVEQAEPVVEDALDHYMGEFLREKGF